jgi:hypothetical protein
MVRQAQPPQSSNDDDNAPERPERPDVSMYMTRLEFSRNGESVEHGVLNDGDDE